MRIFNERNFATLPKVFDIISPFIRRSINNTPKKFSSARINKTSANDVSFRE